MSLAVRERLLSRASGSQLVPGSGRDPFYSRVLRWHCGGRLLQPRTRLPRRQRQEERLAYVLQ